MTVEYLEEGAPWQDQDLGGKQPGKSVCVVRYGGFGDMIQASSIFRSLHADGWDITVNTAPEGHDIIKHDPHVKRFFLQKQNQVPNDELGEYWEKMSENYSRFIQLSQSIEQSLLFLPDREEYKWSYKKRHKAANIDYYKRTHDIAGVPMPPYPKFYATDDERDRAKEYREKLDAEFVILWSLSGSSVHKVWAYTDSIIARLMIEHPGVKIVLVGDVLCQLLEDPWRDESRVIPESGQMKIRDTLALATEVDLVVGPETGVLNCVAFEDVPKIIMLSHSSPINIGGNWVNTKALVPYGVDCYPCHKMHYGWSTCKRDKETGTSLCGTGISAGRVYKAIETVLSGGAF